MHDLWPWRYWMTIGIGCICSNEAQSDCFVMASDHLGTFDEAYTTRNHSKIAWQPDHKIFSVCADSVENAMELLGAIAMEWQALPVRSFGALRQGLQNAVTIYRHHRFYLDVLPRYGIVVKNDNWFEIAKLINVDKELKGEWDNQNLGCEIVLGTFDMRGMATVYYIGSDGGVQTIGQPGFIAIGSGGPYAQFWLAHRQQTCHMSILRSAYHAYEAKIMAEHNPFVGKDDIAMMVCTPKRVYILTQNQPEIEGCPVSLIRLKGMVQRYGPRDTADLDPRKA